MKTHHKPLKRKDARPRWHGLTIIAALVAALSATNAPAQAPAAPTAAAAVPAATQLETLVSRIALYPDDLVTIILPASTNPLQLVQADRFLEKRKADPKAPMDEKWDDAVKTLLNYPDIVKSMSADLDWTADLGEAVVTDQGAVLEAIQSFRRKTQAAGNLKSDDKQVVVVEKEVIKIVPADPQVIYVPQYNPTTVVAYGGYSAWGYYPAPYPSYYYPYAPGAALATGLIWGAAIGAAWNGGRYNTNWGGGGGNNTINIDNSKSFQGGDRTRSSTSTGGGRQQAGGGSQWKSNKQPGQVSGSVGKQPSGGRAGGAGAGAGAGGGARPSTQPGGGGRDMGGGGAGGGAFSGAGSSGRTAQMDSSRGASSRDSMGGSRGGASAGSMQSGGARASGGGGGGGARAGGGGGGRSGGGGGRGGGGRR